MILKYEGKDSNVSLVNALKVKYKTTLLLGAKWLRAFRRFRRNWRNYFLAPAVIALFCLVLYLLEIFVVKVFDSKTHAFLSFQEVVIPATLFTIIVQVVDSERRRNVTLRSQFRIEYDFRISATQFMQKADNVFGGSGSNYYELFSANKFPHHFYNDKTNPLSGRTCVLRQDLKGACDHYLLTLKKVERFFVENESAGYDDLKRHHHNVDALIDGKVEHLRNLIHKLCVPSNLRRKQDVVIILNDIISNSYSLMHTLRAPWRRITDMNVQRSIRSLIEKTNNKA